MCPPVLKGLTFQRTFHSALHIPKQIYKWWKTQTGQVLFEYYNISIVFSFPRTFLQWSLTSSVVGRIFTISFGSHYAILVTLGRVYGGSAED